MLFRFNFLVELYMIPPKLPTLGEYCKWFEFNCSPENMMPLIPTIIRLDGVNFHSWTKGLDRPYDSRLTSIMKELTKELVDLTNAKVGYTQSDEITLVLYSDDITKKIYHNGEKSKILSKLAAFTSVVFNEKVKVHLPEKSKLATFDARIFQVPNLEWAYKQLLWRENDAIKNSVSTLAQTHFPHKSLQHLKRDQLIEKLLIKKNIVWSDYPDSYKRGTYFKRKVYTFTYESMSAEELAKLPPKHNAFKNPELKFERSLVEELIIPVLITRDMNWVEALF